MFVRNLDVDKEKNDIKKLRSWMFTGRANESNPHQKRCDLSLENMNWVASRIYSRKLAMRTLSFYVMSISPVRVEGFRLDYHGFSM